MQNVNFSSRLGARSGQYNQAGVSKNRPKNHRRAIASAAMLAIGGLAGGLMVPDALAATSNSTWTDGAATSLWSNPGNWSPAGVPNNGTNGFSDYNVSIGTPSPTVLTISPTIDNLTINSGGMLDIQYASTLTVNGPTLTDNGSIVINSNQGSALAELAFGANTAISGSGVITLQEPGSNAQLAAAAGITVTQASTHTIAGYGQLNLGFVNNGIVNANVSSQVLTLGTYNMSNNLTFEATNGGTLSINGITVTQGTSGVISSATASAVGLSNANISGGTISSSGTGSIQIGGVSTINRVTNSGVIDIPYNQTLQVIGNLVDNGSIIVNSNQGSAPAALNFSGGTLSGSGTITLQQQNDALINGSLTQSAGHSIVGYGIINASVTNNGTINANIPSTTLTLTGAVTNNSVLEATAGGTLVLSGITVTNTAGQVTATGNNSAIYLTNTNLSGGALNSGTGAYVYVQGTSTLSNVTNSAVVDIPYSQSLNIVGNLSNSGTIVVNNNQGGLPAILNFSGGTLSGTGSIVMQQQYDAFLNGSLTQSAGHTISGYGVINATLTNQGTVNANIASTTLYFEGTTLRNSNLLEATNGSLFFDSGIAVNNSGGSITASGAGGNITLANGTSITGGSLSATTPNVVSLYNLNATAGYTAQLNGVSLSTGTELDIPYSNTLSILGSTFTNNGLIVVNSNQGALVAELLFNANTLLTGSGTIRLQQPGGNALLATAAGDVITQDIHHSILGYGEITAGLVNNNIVNANVLNQTLYLDTNNKTNNLTFEATNGGTLLISGINVTQGVNGVITAANGSAVSLTNSNVTNGVLSTTGTGSFQIAGISSITSLTSNALIDLPYYQTLLVNGNLINNGTIIVNSNTGGAVAALNFSGGTLSGTGSIVLQEGNNNAQINGSLTQSAGETIQGYGQINATMTNNGTINTNISGQALTIAGAMTNNSLVEATNGATLVITGVTITQGSLAQISAGNSSAISLTNANISGGAINSAANNAVPPAANNAGYFVVQGISTLNNVSSGALIDIPYYQELNIVGNLINNGTIIVNSNTGGVVSALNFSGGTLSGTGSIVLQEGNNNAQINGSLTQSAGHTIQGYGQINATLTNNGTINSNVTGQTLTLAAPLTNNSLIEVTAGGINLTSTITQGAAGQITEAVGTGITMTNSTIIGGVFSGAGVATVSGVSTLNNVNNSSTILIPYYQELNIVNNLIDNGSIVVNSNNGGVVAALNFSGGTVSGTGTITLQQPGSNAQLNGPLTQAAGHTIAGYGQITGTFVNNGTVNANVLNQTLYVYGTTTGVGAFQASNGGTLYILGSTTIGAAGSLIGGGAASPIVISAGGSLTDNGSVAGLPAITDSGTFLLAANPGTGILTRSLTSLNITSTGLATIATPGVYANRTLLVTSGLTFAGSTNNFTGRLELGDNDLLVHGGSLGDITNQTAEGYNNGKWNGSAGITSSVAGADPTHLTALGVIQNNQSGSALFTASHPFDGTTPGVADIIERYTYYGDTNLDGKVDGSDYSRIDAAYAGNKTSPGKYTGWFNGDFNYDGAIDGSDYTLIDNAFNRQGAVIAASVAAQIGGSTSAVPEPTVCGLMCVVAIQSLSRRRRISC